MLSRVGLPSTLYRLALLFIARTSDLIASWSNSLYSVYGRRRVVLSVVLSVAAKPLLCARIPVGQDLIVDSRLDGQIFDR